MYLYFSEIEDCYNWFSYQHDDQESKNTNQAYNAWRAKLQTVLGQMLKSAAPDDKKLIGDMLDLLKNVNPSREDMMKIREKFDDLHLRYGTYVPDQVRRQIMSRP